jgi:hypothetical protein
MQRLKTQNLSLYLPINSPIANSQNEETLNMLYVILLSAMVIVETK